MSRPTWVAGASACPSFSGFSAVDAYPIRSPLVVADFLGAQLAGRSFAEIGTRNGDVMSCVSHFTPRVTAIEMDPGYCAQLRQRGFGVACSMFEDLADADFPVADVYYWWPSDAGGQTAPRDDEPVCHSAQLPRHRGVAENEDVRREFINR